MVLAVCVFVLVACSQADSTPTSTTVPTPTSVPGDRAAKDGDTVAVHYTGTLDSGAEFDSSLEREPLSFVLGSGQMIPGFDAAVHGLKVGDAITVRLEPEEAYGQRRDDLIIDFPIAQLPAGLTQGATVFSQSGLQGVILEVTGETFKIDFNHRLAGQALTFEIELVSIQ
jgi:peptidylprolyl isomerase